MSGRNEVEKILGNTHNDDSFIVVAGPSSSLTIPGIIVSQIVQSIFENNAVMRIDVDSNSDFDAGLHRSPSLAAAHHSSTQRGVVRYAAPGGARLRAQAFRQWIPADARAGIAFAWPGLDNSWIKHFVESAKDVGAPTMVVCISLPKSNHDKLVALADVIAGADLVLVGTDSEAASLKSALGDRGPVVEMHKALCLQGRADKRSSHQITAFLQRDNYESLTTLLAAYDAIPEAWIPGYHMKIVMRFTGDKNKQLVEESYHGQYVQLIGDDISSPDLNDLCSTSSAIIIADPAFDSRAFSVAMDCGVAVVVLASVQLPDVGHGYVGALLADASRPVSVHVALTHALRLAELHFPRPDDWVELVERLLGVRSGVGAEASLVSPNCNGG